MSTLHFGAILTKSPSLPDYRVLRLLRDHRFQLYALFAVAAIMFLRSPELFWEPRFWAEEGNVYYKRALVTSWWDTLVYTYPTAGYYALATSLFTGIAAKLFPLFLGPTVTTLLSFIVQLLPFVIILWGRSFVWSQWPQKLLACGVLVLNVNGAHVWLNTINLQSWFGLISACILLENWGVLSRPAFGLQAFLHVLGCLTGPYSLFLAPVFGLKALMVRHLRSWLLVGLTLMAGIYQVVEVGAAQKKMNKSRRPISEMTLQEPFAISFAQHVVTPIAGVKKGFEVMVGMLPKDGQKPWMKGLPLTFLLLTMLLLVQRTPALLWLTASFLLGSILTTMFSFNFWAGARYAAFPSFILSCLLVASVDFEALRMFFQKRARPPVRSLVCLLLCLLSMVMGIHDFRWEQALAYRGASPVWSEELGRWREDPQYHPKIWPVTEVPGQWKIRMKGVDPNRP